MPAVFPPVIVDDGSVSVALQAHEMDTSAHGVPDNDSVAGQNWVESLVAEASAPRYVHDQGVAAQVWVMDHNFGFIPASVSVVDSAGTLVLGDIQHVSPVRTIATFSAQFSGTAYLR